MTPCQQIVMPLSSFRLKANLTHTGIWIPDAWSLKLTFSSKGRIQAVWEAHSPVWVPKLWHPKNTFQVLFFQLYFNKKCWNNEQWFQNASNYLKMALKDKNTESRKTERKRRPNERRNCLWKCFHLSKYVIHHENVRFFFLISLRTCSKSLNDVNSFHYFVWFLLYCLLHLSSSDRFAALAGL